MQPIRTGKPTTKSRGYGYDHERQRLRLLRNLRDGDPCWWCGRPLHRDRDRNFDGRSLNADHGVSLAKGGTKADRLLHDTCNKQRGDGSRDALRPSANGGIWPPVKNAGTFHRGKATPVVSN